MQIGYGLGLAMGTLVFVILHFSGEEIGGIFFERFLNRMILKNPH